MENVKDDKENQSLVEHSPKVSIQEAFKKFQKEKFYQLKLNKYLKNVQVDRTAPEFKQQLREKFIETAKKYIGIPYGQKYHQPGDPLYDSPLFIDCCALVRQCVFDLRQEFGYTLAKWNQSYQFDLLPDEGLTLEQLKPGDLIFYSATYRNEKLKPFPHKMVHVEIYMGEGKTIGARWQKGTIQIFDSYKFDSTLYYGVEHHYRSIDAWLEGKFESHCKEHKWLDERANEWLSDKFSVFADPSLDDMNLESNSEKKHIKDIMIGKGNNCKLVREYFESKGENYNILPEKDVFSPHFYYKWVQSTGEVDFYSFKEGKQLVNHIPNIGVISSKLELLRTLKECELELSSKDLPQTLTMREFIPKTYRLDVMSDEIEFLNDETEGVWIYKPRNLNQGKGIRMIADIKQFKKEFIDSKKFYLGEFSLNHMIYYKPELDPTSNSNATAEQGQSTEAKYADLKHDGLIQHYIKPLLLEGRKFDIRCYMLVYSDPSVVLFNPGYLRLCIEPYSEADIENPANLLVHLTNNSMQYKHPQYKQRKEETIATWALIEAEIGKEAKQALLHQIKRILTMTYCAAKRKLMTKKGTYELLGCDIMVGADYRPYLLEVNTNPAMFTDTKVQKELIPPLVKNTLDVVLGLFEGCSAEKIADSAATYGYEPLFCPESGFFYNCSEQEKKIGQGANKDQIEINGILLKNPAVEAVCQELSLNPKSE